MQFKIETSLNPSNISLSFQLRSCITQFRLKNKQTQNYLKFVFVFYFVPIFKLHYLQRRSCSSGRYNNFIQYNTHLTQSFQLLSIFDSLPQFRCQMKFLTRLSIRFLPELHSITPSSFCKHQWDMQKPKMKNVTLKNINKYKNNHIENKIKYYTGLSSFR